MVRRPGLLRRSWWRDEGYYSLRPRRHEPVAFWPELPDRHTTIWKVLSLLGRPLNLAPGLGDAAFAWEDATLASFVPDAVNGSCVDISKTTVDRAMREVFGYALALDPAAHQGPMVVKSEENTAHDGQVVSGPVQREPGRVYQRVVDNRVGDEVLDLRLVKVGPALPVAYLKFRPVEQRFENTNSRAMLIDPAEVLRPGELDRVAAVAVALGLDFGEIDVLRDRIDGQAYVVDVNKTPWGPPHGIPVRDGWRAMRLIAESVPTLID